MKLKFAPLHKRNTSLLVIITCSPLLTLGVAQNTSQGDGSTTTWNSNTWSNGVPDRADGVQDLTRANGESVEVIGSDIINIDGSSAHGSGTLQYTGANAQPGAGAGSGYVDTSSHLLIQSGTVNMSGSTQLDVGMAHGGPFLAGSGTPETASGTGTWANGDSQLSSTTATYDGAVDSAYRDVSYWNQTNKVDNQLYIPTSLYNPNHNPQSTATLTTVNEFPLFEAGGFLHIGHTGSDTGTFNMNGGTLNVVQYGWGWGSDSIDGVNYLASGTSNWTGTAGWTGANPATQGTTAVSRFEGFELDDTNGGYNVDTSGDTLTPTANASGAAWPFGASTSFTFVDASELDNGYYHSGDTNQNGASTVVANALIVDAGGGTGNYPFDDPPIATDWWLPSNTGPFGAETTTGIPASVLAQDNTDATDASDGVAPLVDYYHPTARSGGNIRVGTQDESNGYFNITDGIVTTNNIEIGRLGDAQGTVSQTGGDVFTRESIHMAQQTATNLATGTDGVYNFGNTSTNGMDATTVFNNTTDGEDTGGTADASNNFDGNAQYYGRTSTGAEFGDSQGTNAAGFTYAPTPDGGGTLETARNINIADRAQAVFNYNAAPTFTFTNPDDGSSSVRDSQLAVGGSINMAQGGGDLEAYAVFNYDSSADLIATGRDIVNDINIGTGNSGTVGGGDNDNLGIFNYNPTAGQIGSLDPDKALMDGPAWTGTGRNEFDTLYIGSGSGAEGYFNHNNAKTVYIDSSTIIGGNASADGTLNLLGQPDAAAYNAATGVTDVTSDRYVDPTKNEEGGIEIDDWLYVGLAGHGVVNQTAKTDISITDGNRNLDIEIGFWDESSAEGPGNGSVRFWQANTSYGEYNFGLPDAGDNMVHSGDSIVGDSRADDGSNNLGTVNTPTIGEVRNIDVGVQGQGVFNYYADTASLQVDNNINIGDEHTGVGVVNIINDSGVTLSTGANQDINIGESGKGTFNQGTFINNNAAGEIIADGNTGRDSTVNTNGGDLVVGGAENYRSSRQSFSTEIYDSGEGVYNYNATDAHINLGGGTLDSGTQTASGKILIGTGQNIQEGLMYFDNDNDGLATTQNISVVVGTDPGTGANITETRVTVQDARNPWEDLANSNYSGTSWTRESGEDADENTLGTGSVFNVDGAANTWGIEGGAATNLNGDAVSQNFIAGHEDGQGAYGEFNHNNNVDLRLRQEDISIADGDNSIGLYNQNGTGDVIMQGNLEMSVDRFDGGNASLAAPNASALAAATAGSSATQFEMGQSTFSVNNADAVLDLKGFNITGDSVDIANGDGASVHDTHASGGPAKGNLQNRANEAQVNLYNGTMQNTGGSMITADVVQYGGTLNISADGGNGAETMTLDANHDFIQLKAGTSVTLPGATTSIASAGGDIEFTMTSATKNFNAAVGDIQSNVDPEQWNATSTIASTVGGLTTANNGAEIDTIVADYTDFSYDMDSIVINFDEGALSFEAGMYWDLADFSVNEVSDYVDHGMGDAFVLPALGTDPTTGTQMYWSVEQDPSALTQYTVAPDIWDTHGIIYIYAEGQILPEPSTALLAGLGGLTLLGRRKRKA